MVRIIIAFILIISSINGMSQQSIKCYDKILKEEKIIKTCFWKNIKCIRTEEYDYKGRSYFTNKLYKKINDKYTEISNLNLFKISNRQQLLSIINQQINKEVLLLKKDMLNNDCLVEVDVVNVTFDNLTISLNDSGFKFEYDLGLGGACYSINTIEINYSFGVIEKYINY